MLKAKDLKLLLKSIPDDEEICVGANNVKLEVKFVKLSTDNKILTLLSDPDEFIESTKFIKE